MVDTCLFHSYGMYMSNQQTREEYIASLVAKAPTLTPEQFSVISAAFTPSRPERSSMAAAVQKDEWDV